jgi:hypothetical protein
VAVVVVLASKGVQLVAVEEPLPKRMAEPRLEVEPW